MPSESNQLSWPDGFTIEYIWDENDCNKVCNSLLSYAQLLKSKDGVKSADSTYKSIPPFVVGFDLEWYFSLIPGQKASPVALAQVFSPSHRKCWLFQLSAFATTRVPQQFQNFLYSDCIAKVGLNITGDIQKLYRDFRVQTRCCIELNALAWHVITFGRSMRWSLSKLVGHLTGKQLPKPSSERKSDWEAFPLSVEQQYYAAMDSYASYYCLAILSRSEDRILASYCRIRSTVNCQSKSNDKSQFRSERAEDGTVSPKAATECQTSETSTLSSNVPNASSARLQVRNIPNELRLECRILPIWCLSDLMHAPNNSIKKLNRNMERATLTPNERVTYNMLQNGCTTTTIAKERRLSKSTVMKHCVIIITKGYQVDLKLMGITPTVFQRASRGFKRIDQGTVDATALRQEVPILSWDDANVCLAALQSGNVSLPRCNNYGTRLNVRNSVPNSIKVSSTTLGVLNSTKVSGTTLGVLNSTIVDAINRSIVDALNSSSMGALNSNSVEVRIFVPQSNDKNHKSTTSESMGRNLQIENSDSCANDRLRVRGTLTPTERTTYSMLCSGLPVGVVAVRRRFELSTIYKHCTAIVAKGYECDLKLMGITPRILAEVKSIRRAVEQGLSTFSSIPKDKVDVCLAFLQQDPAIVDS